MEVKDFICMQIDGVKRYLDRVLDGLTQDEISWRPGSGCNSIGLILLHIARVDDGLLIEKLMGQEQVWKAEKWYEKLNLDPNEEGAHLTVEQVDCFAIPPLKDLLAYMDAAREKLIALIKNMPVENLDKKIDTPFAGEIPMANLLGMMIGHTQQHLGEISYLRGMRRGMDK